jgi:hypothetical protein
LQPFICFLQGTVRVLLPTCSQGCTHTSHRASSPFHIALLSSKTCGFPRHANLDIRVTRANFFQLSKIFVPLTNSDRNVSAPGGAHWRFGAATAIQHALKIKNPASSAGRVRPFPGPLSPRPLGRICSMLDCFLPGVRNQPHLWMRRRTRYVRRIPGK